jgi:carbonic anhydrase
MSKISRRGFLRKGALVVGSSVITACLQRPPSGSVQTIKTSSGEELLKTLTAVPGGEETLLETEPPHVNTTSLIETKPADAVVFKIPPDQALASLIDGNQRFKTGQAQHPREDEQRRTEMLAGQSPFAIVLTCSDSRLPPEILFDQGIGDIFVVRTAGNVAEDLELGSIEYAVEHLGVSLIMVLGHQKCGAVTAAAGEGEAAGHILNVVEAIKPSVEKARATPGDLVSNSINQNVLDEVAALKNSEPILKEFVDAGKVEVVGARYDLDTGGVTLISASEKIKASLKTRLAGPSATQLSPKHASETKLSTPQPSLTLQNQETLSPTSTETQVVVEPTVTRAVVNTETPSARGTTTPGILGKHEVRSGETLLAIARAYGVDPNAITRQNNLSNPNQLTVGQVLWIPDVHWDNPSSGPVAQRQF